MIVVVAVADAVVIIIFVAFDAVVVIVFLRGTVNLTNKILF